MTAKTAPTIVTRTELSFAETATLIELAEAVDDFCWASQRYSEGHEDFLTLIEDELASRGIDFAELS